MAVAVSVNPAAKIRPLEASNNENIIVILSAAKDPCLVAAKMAKG
jgi:hypothetical protein